MCNCEDSDTVVSSEDNQREFDKLQLVRDNPTFAPVMLLSHVDVGGDVNCDEWLGLVERNIALNSDHMDVMWESQPELEPPEWNSVKIRGETVLTKMEQLRGVPIAENQEQLLELEWNTQSGKDMEFSVSKSNLREESVHFTTVLNYSDFDLVPVPVSIVSTSVIPEVHVVVTNGVACKFGMACEKLPLFMHLGGTFVENPKKNYVGGVVEVWNLDPDYVSHGDLCELVIEAGFRGVKSMYYLKPGGSISDGLVLCWDNKSFNDLIGHWLVEGEINVFVEHSVDVLDFVEAPLAIEARVVTHEQGDNRDNTVKEGKTVTESEVIGEGLNNNINCGGPTEGDIEFEDANVNDVGRNINEFEDTSGGVEEEGDRSGGVEEEDKSGGVEEEEGISERSGEVEEGIPPSFERDYEADRFGGDKDEKDEDDILEDVEWVSDREDEELQKIQEHFRSFKKKSQHDAEIDDIVDQVRRRRAAVKEKTTNKSNGAGSETDYIDSSDLGSYETNGDGEVHCKKSKVCCFDPTDLVPCFQLGMLFENSKQFKSTLTRYAIAKRFDFRLAKNDKDKTRAVCKGEGCPFTIYASIDFGDNLYKVKTFVDKHTCSVTFKNSRVNYKVLAEHFLPKLRIIPNLKSTDMVKFAKEELKVDVSMGVCRRARDLAKEEITRNYRHEFKRLFDYANALRRADSDGTIDLLVERPTPNYKLRFKRFYVCFSAMQKGFRECCRPFVSLDGCFLKGMLAGVLLVDVGKDANNQMYPTAWALVECETKHSWKWFLKNLRKDLHMMNGERFTVMSYMQKGLIEAIASVLPEAQHRFCARHCKATSEAEFRKKAAALGEVKGKALLDMLKENPSHWSKAFFSSRSLCDYVDNNIAEAFNARLIGVRHMSIISMFEEIRHYVMKRNVNNKTACIKWTNPIYPRICVKVEEVRERSAYCHVSWNGANGFEVLCGRDIFVVDIKERKCTCSYWNLTGIPCEHDICVILFRKELVETYILDCYIKKKQVYEKCYSFVIPPLAGEKFWPVTKKGDIEPPLPRKLPGRLKKNRIREECECSGTKLSRKERRMRCKLCFKLETNSRTCPTKKQNQNNVTSGIESVTQPAAQPESVNQPVAQPESVTQPAAHPESVTQEPGVQPESVTQEPIQHEIVDTIFDMPLNCSSGSQVCVYPSVVRSESRGRKIMEKTQGPKKQVTRTTARKSTSKRSTRNQATSAPTPTLPTPPLYTQELRAYLMELGSKRSLMECDDVPNTQESTTATKKQKKEKQTMTTSKKK
ncbi:hypothetical protein V6N13_020341 [Hibiscus sabdariffa]